MKPAPWRAVVIRNGTVFLHDGETGLESPTSIDAYPAEILTRAGALFAPVGEGTVLWWGGPRYGTPATPKMRESATKVLLNDAAAAGWKSSEKGAETGWFTFTKAGAPTVHLGIAQWIDQKKTPLFSIDQTAPPAIAMLLARYHIASGAAWRMTAGMAGCAAIRNLAERDRPTGQAGLPVRTAEPLWRWDKAPETVIGCSWETRWNRPLTPAEGQYEYVHQFDIRAAYLAAAGVARLAWSAPRNVGATMFEPTAAGYWKVQHGPRPGQLRKSTLIGAGMLIPDGRISPDGEIWLTTPVMSYLAARRIHPEVHDAWVADRTGTYLKRWADRLRDARWSNAVHAELLHPAIKATYSRTVGTLGKPGGRVYRPDWRDTIVDTARVNLRRKLDAAAQILGVFPIWINVDSVYYADDDPDAKMVKHALAARDDQLGKFRFVRSYTMNEWLNRSTAPRSRV